VIGTGGFFMRRRGAAALARPASGQGSP